MKIKRYSDMDIYDIDWEKILPQYLTVHYWENDVNYKLGNVMRQASSVQIVYFTEEWGEPGDLEFDFYFDDKNTMVDITMGNAIVRSFTINPPSGVSPSFIPKDNFKINPEDLDNLIDVFNSISGIRVTKDNFGFLK